jgi:hypothetical protein
MSHIAKIELEVTDLECLSKACDHLGLDLMREQTTFKWFKGDCQCQHAIKVPDAIYEIGLVKNQNHYELQTDFFDNGIEAAIGPNGGRLKQRYAVEKTLTAAKTRGFRIIEKKTDNGIQIHVRM